MFQIKFSVIFLALTLSCASTQNQPAKVTTDKTSAPQSIVVAEGQASAYFASGCFWCVEEIFEAVVGVDEVISGYAGGTKESATYEKVSSGRTKHAEAVHVIYRPDVISYEELLNVFFLSHDPTTLNQQGPDRGPQYRSAIFYQNKKEQAASENKVRELTEKEVYQKSITTEIAPLDVFYPAEDYHQDYVTRNPSNGYVRGVSQPRFNKFKAAYKGKLKGH